MISIQQALNQAKKQMHALDADFLLMHVMNQSRAYLYTYPSTLLNAQEQTLWLDLLHKKHQGIPLAYLTGHQPFWNLDFKVTQDTLIPRPETEQLVETALSLLHHCPHAEILDLGTGSGAIALSLAKERPAWKIHATDKYPKTLAVAQENQQRLYAPNVIFYLSNWFDCLPQLSCDVIISNPPYIAEQDPHLPALQYEPQTALTSTQNGLADLQHIIQHSKPFLRKGGYLILEHGFRQQVEVVALLKKYQWKVITEAKDISGNDRMVVAVS
jgi:release factor glutamine methyltransferase